MLRCLAQGLYAADCAHVIAALARCGNVRGLVASGHRRRERKWPLCAHLGRSDNVAIISGADMLPSDFNRKSIKVDTIARSDV